MCTILYLHHVHPHFPLVIAANRDESYARPAAPPAVDGSAPRVLAGHDLHAGGTWMGVNELGIFVGLTNQRTYRAPDPAARSRGEVVRSALSARSLGEIEAQLARLEPASYNAFNLLFGDGERLLAAYARPELARVEVETAPAGVGVLPNDRIGAPGFPKAERAIALATPIARKPWHELSQGLAAIVADHQLAALEELPEPPVGAVIDRARMQQHSAICTHTDTYGTCSSTLLALEPGRVHSYLFADGPPCRARFRERVGLLSSA